MNDQQVLCLPRTCLTDRLAFTPWDVADWLHRAAEAGMTWMPRAEAETSEEFIQPIPCALVRGEGGGFYVFRRTKEGRADLQSKISMVVGGHIDWEPGTPEFTHLVRTTLLREIAEELAADSPACVEPIGVVVDDATPQSSRHIGIVHEIVVSGTVHPTATEEFAPHSKYAGLLCDNLQLQSLRERMDPWSSLIFGLHIAPLWERGYQPHLL